MNAKETNFWYYCQHSQAKRGIVPTPTPPKPDMHLDALAIIFAFAALQAWFWWRVWR